MTKLTRSIKAQIIIDLQNGKSLRELTKKYNFSKSTIGEIHQEHINNVPKHVGGRPSALSSKDRDKIVLSVKSGQNKTAVDVQKDFYQNLNIDISAQTVRRVLKDAGMKAKKKVKKPRLNKKHFRDRLEFARKYQSWTINDWKKVLWTDETKVNKYLSDGIQYSWVNEMEGLSERQIQQTVKFGGGSVLFWGCMAWDGPGFVSKIEGNMDASLYIDIIDECVKLTLEYYKMDAKSFYFQQDNDPKHTSASVKKYLEKQGWRILDRPAQSPDLNPIEHLWRHLKIELSRFPELAKDFDELWKRIHETYYKILKEVCQNLIKSMPDRIKAVIKAKGGHTKY
jgi:transposase